MKPYYSLSDFPDRKNAGKIFIAQCPKCGTMHLYISKAKGSVSLLLRRMRIQWHPD